MLDHLTRLPTYITFLIVAADLAVAIALWLGVTRIAKRLALSEQRQRAIALLTALVPATWLIVAPTLATRLGDYLPPLRPGAPHVAMPVLIAAPVVAGLLLLRSQTWNRIVTAAPQHWLIGVQVYRVVGAVFFPLMALNILPAYFGIPAGYGDLIAGIPPPFVAYWVWKRWRGWQTSAIVINLVGLLDFLLAVGIGSGILYSDLSQVLFSEDLLVTQPFNDPPLSLIPLFVVPIGIVLHLYSLIKLFPNEQLVANQADSLGA